MKTLLGTMAVAAALLTVAACGPEKPDDGGPGQDGDAGSSALDPCSLISVDELATVVASVDDLGEPPALTATGPVGEFQGRTCTWTYPRPEVVTDTAEITVTTWHGQEYYTPHALSKDFTAVPGVGDEAHVGPGMFMFRKGDDVFLVAVIGDSNLDALRPAIATAIDDRL
jgi:hypothetical protein